MAEDVTPAESEAAEPDYSSMSTEELEKRLRDGEGDIQEPEPQAEEAPSEQATPEPEEPAVEAKEEAPAEPTPEPEQQEEPPERTPEQLLLEEMQLRLEKVETDRDKWQFLASRNAGELGHLRRLASKPQQPPQQPAEEYPTAEYNGEQQVPQAPQAPQAPVATPEYGGEVAELLTDARERAVAEAGQRFFAEHPEAQDPTNLAQLNALVEKEMEPYRGIALSAKAARKATETVLKAAWAELKISQVQKMRAELQERKAQQVAQQKVAKQAAVVSGAGATPAPKPRQKSPEEMTADEADAELIRLYGDGHSRRRRA